MLLDIIFLQTKMYSHKLLAQVTVQTPPEAAESAALVFSGPQFFTALIAGVVLAFAFQLLLTNLGIASGISLLGASGSSTTSLDDGDGDSFGVTVKKISFVLGLGTLISVTLALFFASKLAVKLSLFAAPISGAIVGLVIWATYFSLLVWVSSTAVGSLIGSVVNTATSGFQAILGTATAAFAGKAASKQVVATVEAATAAVRRELGAAIDPDTLRSNVEEYIDSIRPAKLDLKAIAADFEQLLEDENFQDIVNSEYLQDINRQTFVDLVSDRTDLSKRDVHRIAAKLESVWQKKIKQLPAKSSSLDDISSFLQTATRDQLLGDDFGGKLDGLVQELKQQNRQKQEGTSPLAQAATIGFNALMGIVMGRTDLSDLDVEKIADRLQTVSQLVGEKTHQVASQMGVKPAIPNVVRRDIENYLLNAYNWQLQPQNLQIEFRDLIYDPYAEPGIVASQLRQINRADFVKLLKQKGLLTQTQIQSIANILESIRLEVLATAEAAQEREAAIALLNEVEIYLHNTPKSEFTPEKINLNFKPILLDQEASCEQLINRLAQLDRPTLERFLEVRGDMDQIEITTIANELETARDMVLQEATEIFGRAKAKAEQQWYKVQSYLRDTGKQELNPIAIERELKILLQDPETGANLLKARAGQFDRDTLVKLLTTRNDLSETQVNEIIDTVEDTWHQIASAPQKIVHAAQTQYDQTMDAIAEYLRNTGKSELNPAGIKRDLNLLLSNPKLGFRAIKQRLAAMDRDTLVQLLAQRDDLTPQQVNQIIDEVQQTIQEIAKAPQRFAYRTQQKFQNFQAAIAEYLRSTDKAELNPEGIKRDLQLLLQDPRLGMESLKVRLSQFDRSTLVALLSQREDLSEAEINQTIDQILAVRDQAMEQLQMIQLRIQNSIQKILDKIRDYLNSLERPELNYEGIRQDIYTLFHDPEAGFEALRDRFSQIDRDTVIAVLSSRDDISQADAELIVHQIERTRNQILQRAERIQQEAQIRLEQIKYQAQKQVEETRKAAAVASWWLFFTALISAIASASGGYIGVSI